MIAAALLHASAANADSQSYRDKLESRTTRIEFVNDLLSAALNEANRRDIVMVLERDAPRAKEQARQRGGVLYSVHVYRGITNQPVTGHPSLIQRYGTGKTPEAALVAHDEPGLAGQPEGVRFDGDSSGYLFATITASGSLQYAKFFGDSARALRRKADALAQKQHPNRLSVLIGVAGTGGVPVSTKGSRNVDIVHAPDRRESQERRNQEQSERQHQQAAQLEHHREDQKSIDGHEIQEREREARELRNRGERDDEPTPVHDNKSREKAKDKPKRDPERSRPRDRPPAERRVPRESGWGNRPI